MTYKEIKQAQAEFKTWYIPRLRSSGTYRITAAELSNGLRFAVERNGELYEIWRKDGNKYVRVI